MKILIWLATILVFNFLNAVLAAYTGFKLGVILVWIPIFFVAKKLCGAWENHKKKKQDARYDAMMAARRSQEEP